MKDKVVDIAQMTRELDQRIRTGNVKDEDIPRIAQEIIRNKRIQLKPEISSHPTEGRMMMDAYGHKAMVLPDGSIKEIGDAEPRPRTN